MRETLAALGAGIAIAAVVSCGAKMTSAPATVGGGVPVMEKRDPRIVELDHKITDEMAKLGTERPPLPTMSMCPTPPCNDAVQTIAPKHTEDPTCKPAASGTCTEMCTLSDSICDSAGKICNIATELPGDAWAAEKCSNGNASCEAAHKKCCGCAL